MSGRLRPYKTWRPVEQATMAYGYGLSASLFQMARAYTVFAHDGQIIPVTLLKSRRSRRASGCSIAEDGRRSAHMLHMVAGPGGTAPEGADAGLLGRRQVGHGATSRTARATPTNKYRGVVRRHRADREAAHRRRP